MKNLILAFVLALGSLSAQAADSTWLLCDNGSLALNVLEHRAGASGRATSLTLIYGMHIMKGELVNADAGAISLDGSEPGAVKTFNGNISISYQKNAVVLSGAMDLYGTPTRVRTQLKCKVMKN
jgi:hypothetical protein